MSRDADIGRRISEARTALGMSQATLASRVGLGPTVMSKVESGKRSLDGFELAVVAEALGTTSRALLGMATRTAALAAAARIGAGSSEPALRRARDLLELDGVADELGLDGRATPHRGDARRGRSSALAGALAHQVRTASGAGNDGIGDLIGIVERDFGIDVALEPLGDGPAGVLVQHHDEIALIVLNSDHEVARRRFTLAHELGHWLLGDAQPLVIDDDLGGNEETEKRADAFAVELLMPEDGVRRVMRSATSVDGGVVDALVQFGVGRETLLARLRALRLIDSAQTRALEQGSVRSLFARAGRQADYDAWSVAGPARRVPSRMEKRLISAYIQGRIGIGMLAQAFNEPPAVLENRLKEDGIVADFAADADVLRAI